MSNPNGRPDPTDRPQFPGETLEAEKEQRPEMADVSALNNPDELRSAAPSEGTGVSGNFERGGVDEVR